MAKKFRISKLTPYKGEVMRAEATEVVRGQRRGTGVYSDREISSNGRPIIRFYSGEGVRAGARINQARARLFEATFEEVKEKDED